MAPPPPPLSPGSSFTARRYRPLPSAATLGDAITTAASPLQASFQLSCRSPVSPRVPRSLDGETRYGSSRSGGGGPSSSSSSSSAYSSTYLAAPPRGFRHPLVVEGLSESRTTTTTTGHRGALEAHGEADRNDQDSDGDGDERSSYTAFSPTDRTWFLQPPAPGTPAALLRPGDHDDENDDDDAGKLGVVSTINVILGKTVGAGAYTIPGAVLAGSGSVGAALSLWVLGSLVSFCGLAVYLDLGAALPRSGGERVYLARVFRRPRMLATCLFGAYAVLLGFSAPNAMVLAEYAAYALRSTSSSTAGGGGGGGGGGEEVAAAWAVRAIAVLAVSVLCYVHARFPRLGLRLINILGFGKLAILAFVIASGAVGGALGLGRGTATTTMPGSTTMMMGVGGVMGEGGGGGGGAVRRAAVAAAAGQSTAQRNFGNIWAGSSTQPYDYATALLKVIYCFRGYSTANQVLSDVRDPVRTLRIAAPIALGLASLAYVAVSVAFFLVVDRDAFFLPPTSSSSPGESSSAGGGGGGVVIAGTFFRTLFGDVVGAHILPLFIIVSAAGNIAATSFAQARVNEELAKDGLLPWSDFWTTKAVTTRESEAVPEDENLVDVALVKPRHGSSSRSSSSSSNSTRCPNPPPTTAASPPPSRGLLLHWLVSVAVIVLPPPGRIYNFLVDLGGYPVSVLSVAVSLGLLRLHTTPGEPWTSPCRAPRAAIVVFALANALLLVLPWIPPAGGRADDTAFPFYAYPATALAVLGSGAVYWCWWITKGKGRRACSDDDSDGDEYGRGAAWTKVRRNGGVGASLGLSQGDDMLQLEDTVPRIDVDMTRRAKCGCIMAHQAG